MNIAQIFDVNLAHAIYGIIVIVIVTVVKHHFEVKIIQIEEYIFNKSRIKTQLNEEARIKKKWIIFSVIFCLIFVFSIYYHYRLVDVEEGKIICIFPDGKRKVLPISETHSRELISVFPQLNNTPFVSVTTYATNGKVTSTFHEDKLHGFSFFEISFNNLQPLIECNCGWMIGPLSGFEAHNYSKLSFEVKGNNGGEKFGVKFKDIKGSESKIDVTELGIQVATNWQIVDIELKKFFRIFNVDTSKPYVISIYSDGSLCSGREETIFVRGFKFS
jgi:hypothetical protein